MWLFLQNDSVKMFNITLGIVQISTVRYMNLYYKLLRFGTQIANLTRTFFFDFQELEIKLTNELTGNLRSIKPEGNLIEDRYKSLQ